MRALPFLAALLCTAPLANAKSELELLQDRCAEMERQIRALETENSHLKSQASTSTKTVIETAKPAATAETQAPAAEKTTTPEPAKAAGPSYATVRSGDTLGKVAKRNGTTTATLIKLNKLKNPSALQIGQKLRLPDKAPAAMAKASTKTASPAPAPVPQGGTHIVKSGETFYSIARNYGLSEKALQTANPKIKPQSLRAGQTLHLGAKAEPADPRKNESRATPITKEALKSSSAPAPEATTTASSESASAPAAANETGSQTVSNSPKLRLVVINEPIDFGAFAAAHGTTTAKLNALNGHNLNPSTVLAKESAFYVPAQP
jgi:LysM repeat protein